MNDTSAPAAPSNVRLGPPLLQVVGSLMIACASNGLPDVLAGMDVPPNLMSVVGPIIHGLGWGASVLAFLAIVRLAILLPAWVLQENSHTAPRDQSSAPPVEDAVETVPAEESVPVHAAPRAASNIGGSIQEPPPTIRSRFSAD